MMVVTVDDHGDQGGRPDDYDYEYQGDDQDERCPPAPKPDDLEFQVGDESEVYRARELPAAGSRPDLPRNAAEFRGYADATVTIFAALDTSKNDLLIKW